MGNEKLSPKERKQKMIETVKTNYRQVEKSIVEQLNMTHALHGSTVGSEREDIWRQIFEMIIPKKFVIEQSVFIIDSHGSVSREVDLAILDEMYTPYIFRYGRIKFIPIEAVAAVVECKSKELNPCILSDWSKSISQLKTSKESIARFATGIAIDEAVKTQQSTRPIRILCALKKNAKPEIAAHFDFTLLANDKKSIEINHNQMYENSNLLDWYMDLNFHALTPKIKDNSVHYNYNGENKFYENEDFKKLSDISLDMYKVCKDDGSPISLLTFNFQLNQLLMLINNPILFPHRAYARMFNGSDSGEGGTSNVQETEL